MEETSVIQLELEKEFGGTGLHLEVELEKVFQLLWSLLYIFKHRLNTNCWYLIYDLSDLLIESMQALQVEFVSRSSSVFHCSASTVIWAWLMIAYINFVVMHQ